MPLLSQLAPKRQYWTTLHDYLQTQAYRLRLFASGDQAVIIAKVEDGPKDTGAYDLEPVPQHFLPQPAGIQLYRSQDLQVLDREKDWRRGPHKVITKDGDTFFFLGCQSGSRNAKTQQVSNISLNAVRAQLKLMETHAGTNVPEGIPQVYGIVADSPILDVSQEHNRVDGGSEQRIAGILLTWIPRGKSLVQMVPVLANLDETEAKLRIRAWIERVGVALKYLHEKGVYFGGREDWRYLNQYTVLVDIHGQPWLDVSHVSWMADLSLEDAKAVDTADGLALERLFEDWLPEEVAKVRGTPVVC